MKKIEITKNWRPEEHKLVTPGVYLVPRDMSRDMADQAIKDGYAKEVAKSAATFPAAKAIAAAPENKAKMARPSGGRGKRSKPDA